MTRRASGSSLRADHAEIASDLWLRPSRSKIESRREPGSRKLCDEECELGIRSSAKRCVSDISCASRLASISACGELVGVTDRLGELLAQLVVLAVELLVELPALVELRLQVLDAVQVGHRQAVVVDDLLLKLATSALSSVSDCASS